MKNSFIWIIVLLVLIGAAFWFLSQGTSQAPSTHDSAAPEQSDEESAEGAPSETYVGFTVPEAEAQAEANGVPFRVVERDGEPLPTTRDFRPGRINAVVAEDVVTSYTVEGREETAPGSTTDSEPNAPESATTSEAEEDTTGEHDAIIGMTEAEAEAYAEANDVPFRIGFRDGEALPLTMDYRPGRITATIEDGEVVEYSVE